MSENEKTKSPEIGESLPRRPNIQTDLRVRNTISTRQPQSQSGGADEGRQVLQAVKPPGTMGQLSLPSAPSGLSATAAVFVPRSMQVKNEQQAYSGYTNTGPASLSANAQEFSYDGREEPYGYDQETLDFYLGNLALDEYEGQEQPYYTNFTESTIEERFDSALKILTSNPSNVEEYLKPICESLASVPVKEPVISNIVENLYQQCISEENFRYTGAKICQCLNSSLKMDSGFVKLFVNRCKVDFDKREMLIRGSPEDKKRFQGLSMLIAEIFSNVVTVMPDGSEERLAFLPPILIKIVNSLLSFHDDANVKCACQLLKLTGSCIEDVAKSSLEHCEEFEGLFVTFKTLLTNSSLSENAKFHLQRIIDLKDNNWSTAAPSNTTSNIYNPYAQNQYQAQGDGRGFYPGLEQEPIFYDQASKDLDEAEAHFLTEEEEADFLAWQYEGYKQDSEMGNEMEEAFEEFLQQQQSPQSNNGSKSNSSYGSQSNSYSQSHNYGSQSSSSNHGSQSNKYASQSNSYGSQSNSYGSQSNSYGSQSNSYGSQSNNYGSQSNSYSSHMGAAPIQDRFHYHNPAAANQHNNSYYHSQQQQQQHHQYQHPQHQHQPPQHQPPQHNQHQPQPHQHQQFMPYNQQYYPQQNHQPHQDPHQVGYPNQNQSEAYRK